MTGSTEVKGTSVFHNAISISGQILSIWNVLNISKSSRYVDKFSVFDQDIGLNIWKNSQYISKSSVPGKCSISPRFYFFPLMILAANFGFHTTLLNC